MIKSLLAALFLAVVLVQSPFAASMNYEFKEDKLIFLINFDRGYSNLEALKAPEGLVVSFDSTEPFIFERQDFFDSAVRRVWVTGEGNRKRVNFSFEDDLIEPVISRQATGIQIEFTLPVVESAVSVPAPSLPGAGAYLRMFFGLGVILVIILVAYGLMKTFFKNSVVTDIPGIGRMLGKVDIDIRKSLVFYELGEIIYLLGVTDGAVNMVDKISDPVDVNLIKSGFSRRKEFSSYLKFFKKKNEIRSDMNDSTDLIEEKLSSLRKK